MAVTSGLDESGVPRTYDLDGLRRRAGVFSLRARAGATAPPTDLGHWDVLMISSLSKERLIIPAGGIDPDELPCCAAVREGSEEAGIDMSAVLAAARARAAGSKPVASAFVDGAATPCCSPLACNACLPLAESSAGAAVPVAAPADASNATAAIPAPVPVSVPGAGSVECPWSTAGGAAASPRSPRCTCICDRIQRAVGGVAGGVPTRVEAFSAVKPAGVDAAAAAAENSAATAPAADAAIRGPVPLGLSISAGKHTRTHYFLLAGVPLLADGTYLEGALRKRRWVSLGDAMRAAEAMKGTGPLTDEEPAKAAPDAGAGASAGGASAAPDATTAAGISDEAAAASAQPAGAASAEAPAAATSCSSASAFGPSDTELCAPLMDPSGAGPNVLARRTALALLDARAALESALYSLYG